MTAGKPGNKQPSQPISKPTQTNDRTGTAVLKGEINKSFSVMNTQPPPPPLPATKGK